MIIREKDYLKHYGVKGMKWGVRRKTRKTSSDYNESREIKKKHVSEMSNEELRKLNKRMDLEQNYKRLNPSYAQRGMKYIGTAVATTGTILALQQNSERLIKLGRRFMR